MVCDMEIALVVHDGCFASGVASILDIVGTADLVRASVDPSIPPLRLSVAGPRRRVVTSAGMVLTPQRSLTELDDVDVVVLAGLGTLTGPDTEAAVTGPAGRATVRALGRLDPASTRFAAACTGVFPLAETGVLDGRRATTTWFLTPTFRARYPAVDVDLDRMVVADGPTLTAGAAFAHIDLALAIVRGVSADLAGQVARLLLVDERASQVAFVAVDHLEHDDPVVLAFERHARRHLDEPLDLARVARDLGTSRRTLERRTREALGMSPLDLVQRLRLERADHLRRTTDLSTDEIAQRVGYASAEALRALRRRAARGELRSVSAR